MQMAAFKNWRKVMTAGILAVAPIIGAAHAQERIVPSVANSLVGRFDDPSLVVTDQPASARAPLVVYLPGTNGRSETAPGLLLKTIQQQGYRVIFLTYDDVPAVSEICPSRLPACSARFRESRVFGGNGSPIATPEPEPEAIVQRLGDLLQHL